MRIFVTGHHGYIGSLLVPMLISNGYKVQGLDSNLYDTALFGNPPVAVPSINKDVRDISRSDLTGCDAIIHLAGLSNDPLGDIDPELTREINFLATVRLAELAKEEGIKVFLFASSCSIYGASSSELIDENSAINPVTPYAHSKHLAEQELSKMADEAFSPTFLRCATAHGYSPRIRFDLVINNLVAWAYTTGRVFIKSDGSPWRPFVHIADICRAFIEILNAPSLSVHDEILNVGETSQNYQIRQVAEFVERIVPGCQVEYAKDGGPDKRNYRVSCDKISQVLPSFTAKWSINKSIKDLLHCYKTFDLKQGEYEGVKYSRIALLRELQHQGKLDTSLRWT